MASKTPQCTEHREHYCVTYKECEPYATECKVPQDCARDSCCIVVDLNAIASNIPGMALPGYYMQTCQPKANETRKVWCYQNRCMRGEPDFYHKNYNHSAPASTSK